MTRRACCSGLLGLAGGVLLAACGGPSRSSSPVPTASDSGLGRGVALSGRIWPGGEASGFDDGVVVVGPDGRVAAVGPTASVPVPEGVRRLGSADNWVGPGLVDAHVHVAFGAAEDGLRGGVVGVRDLGAPPALVESLRRSRAAGAPRVAFAGPLLTSPGGYPSRSWGADGFAAFVSSEAAGRDLVRGLASDGVDLVKIALEPSDGLPVPSPAEVRAVVEAAHEAGLRVTAHALSAEMVLRALDAGVDELAHTPLEPLPEALVERLAASGIPIVSTLQTFFAGGDGESAALNAAALHRAGVQLVYGTDLGNAGTRPGADPRELERLAATGLGRLGALRAATTGSAALLGAGAPSGRLVAGEPAALVLLSADPLSEPGVWSAPLAVVAGGRLLVR